MGTQTKQTSEQIRKQRRNRLANLAVKLDLQGDSRCWRAYDLASRAFDRLQAARIPGYKPLTTKGVC